MFRLRNILAASLALIVAAVASATSVIPPEFPELVNRSDYVVRARVSRIDTEVRMREGRLLPYTHVTLDVIETIAGNPPRPLVLTMLGGRAGGAELQVAGTPKFTVGDEDILFVQGNGKNFHPLYAVAHGRYPVKFDKKLGRTYVARANGVPLAATAEVALPLAEGKLAQMLRRQRRADDALTPAEFGQSIRAARTERTPNGGQRAR